MSDPRDQPGRPPRLAPQLVVKVRHDLRNPLGHVMGFGELLLERAKRQGLTSSEASLRELVETSQQMLDEINHCLDPRRLESGQADLPALQDHVQRFCRRAIFLADQAQGEMGDRVRDDVERIVDSAGRMERLGYELLMVLQGELAAAPCALPLAEEPARPGSDVIGLSAGSGEARDRLLSSLNESGYQVEVLGAAACAPPALARLPIDVLLIELDLAQPESIQLLKGLKRQTATARLPVMVLAREPAPEGVRNALRAGAQDVLRLPLQTDLLLARMSYILALKRLHDQERALLRRIASEQQRTDQFLRGLVPPAVLDRLRHGEGSIAEHYPQVAVLCADFGGLSRWASALSPEEVVRGLTEVFAAYDKVCQQRAVPIGRVYGDQYQVVLGLPEPLADHLESTADLAMALQREALPLRLEEGRLLRARIGFDTGPVSVGVFGSERLAFEVWGEPVELAAALCRAAAPGAILTSSTAAVFLEGRYIFEAAPALPLGESRVLETRLLLGRAP